MNFPPMGADGPQPMGTDEPPLWMTVEDVFHIKGRGTVLTGQLQGDGQLSAGDTVLCAGQRWQVKAIEQFGSVLMAAVPGSNIGVLISDGPGPATLRGQMAWFEPGARKGPPFTVLAPKKRRWRG